MSRAFVLGNGVSRQDVDLDHLKTFGPIYGCNALYRDFVPTALISTDRPISDSIQNSGYALQNKFYTRRPIPGSGALPVPQKYFGYSSGPLATSVAAIDGARLIYLIGFDMGPVNNHFNNVYANTEFYKKSSAGPTYTGNWVNQIKTVIRDYPGTLFVRIMGHTTAVIADLDRLSNLQTMTMSEFLNRINNTKEL